MTSFHLWKRACGDKTLTGSFLVFFGDFSGIFRGLKIKNPFFKGIFSVLAGAAGSIYRVYNRKIKNIR